MKLSNFPSVNYTSLRESVDRRNYMQEQFAVLGIKNTNIYITDRFTNISKYFEIEGSRINEIGLQLGSIISHLNLLRNWYITCNEPYAIFCEDDISFECINYWNFTWDEFIENLPKDWECVQLTRITSTFAAPESIEEDLNLVLRKGRWWGSHSLMKREYVKKVLDKYFLNYNKYRLVVKDDAYIPFIENILFFNFDKHIYNFPMLLGNTNLESTVYKGLDINNIFVPHINKDFSILLNKWKSIDSTFNIKNALSNPY